MPKVSPTHSSERDVYHDNSACTERNNIETRYLQQGSGGKRLCEHCASLNREGK